MLESPKSIFLEMAALLHRDGRVTDNYPNTQGIEEKNDIV